MKDTDIAWAAGVFDGEGTFYITYTQRDNKYYARMKIGMCHEATVRRFAEVIGFGNVSVENNPGPMARFKQYRWGISGQKAVNGAALLYPYLVTKKEEAALLIQWEPLIADGRKTFVTPEILKARQELFVQLKEAKTNQLVKVDRNV